MSWMYVALNFQTFPKNQMDIWFSRWNYEDKFMSIDVNQFPDCACLLNVKS